MTGTTLQYPELCFEIHRYDADKHGPDVFRFYYLKPHAVDHSSMNYQPFRDALAARMARVSGEKPVDSQNYTLVEQKQIRDDLALDERVDLKAQGYRPMAFEDVPKVLADHATHSHAPIEFHSALDGRNPKFTRRVVIWVRGEMPAEVAA
jgi:hypothetical protein